MGRTASIVLPAAGSNILERMKGRHISSKLLAKPGNRLIEGDFYDDQHLFVSVLVSLTQPISTLGWHLSRCLAPDFTMAFHHLFCQYRGFSRC